MSKATTKTVTTVDMELLFRALADKTRLRLLNLIGDDEVCVCFLAEVLATNQPKISRHLTYLRRAGLVTSKRYGKWMHYRIVKPLDPDAACLLAETLTWCKKNAEMQCDRTRLLKVCCK